ncbi:MAG: hypothetical protein JNL69_03455 [Bacteroidia bacterium]|nr:hypothetical protein [Bacteroidia bacterium]
MKNIFILIISLINSINIFGQAYKPELDGKFLPAKIIFGDDVVHDIQMMYQQPEFFKNPLNKFKIIKNNESGSYTHSGGIAAFLIDNNCWALKSVAGQNQFVIFKTQGAIEQFEYIINGKLGEVTTGAYVVIGQRTKTITRNALTNESVEGILSPEKLKQWILNAPEVLEDYNKAEARANEEQERIDSENGEQKKSFITGATIKEPTEVDLNRIINNYNAWYETYNSGKLKYYFIQKPTWINLPERVKSQAEKKAEREKLMATAYSERSTEVSPELASAKDNVPDKKETFLGKMDRIVKEGNKIGVVVYVKPIRNASMTEFINGQEIISEVGAYHDPLLLATGTDLVKELNTALGTNNIELIDINQIPYREMKIMGTKIRIDDFWKTKYKLVFAYTIDPLLKFENMSIKGDIKPTTTINVRSNLVVTEYNGPSTSTSQKNQIQILNMGGFVTPTVVHEKESKEVELMYKKTLEKLEVPILEKIKTERASGIEKVVKRVN